MDYLDCVLHVFVPELRERYRLDVLWGDAPRLELEAETGASGRAASG
jgi:ribosomal silencing factor RsfS